jgi:selenoprotein W-related protein
MASDPVRVSITYCAECGYGPQALDLTKALMNAFGTKLTKIELVPWHDGSFEVAVNGRLVHSMMREGGFPEHDTIIEAAQAQLVAT